MRQLLPGVAMISGTGRNVENSSSGVALTGFLEIPSIAELLSGTEWNLKETMRYVFPENGMKSVRSLLLPGNVRSRRETYLPASTGYLVF